MVPKIYRDFCALENTKEKMILRSSKIFCNTTIYFNACQAFRSVIVLFS